MIFQMPTARDCVFHWTPSTVPDPNSANPKVKLNGGGQTAEITLTRNGIANITGVVDRFTLSTDENLGGAAFQAGLVGDIGGQWYFYAYAAGQFPVAVSHYDDARDVYVLAEALPHGIPADTTGSLIHNHWSCTIPAGTLGAVEDRAAYWEINWTVDFDLGGNNIGGKVFTERGRLRLVNTPFETGLTARDLQTLIPQLESVRPPNRDGWQPLIDSVDIIGAVESRLPSGSFADQSLAEQWKRGHALLCAAHLGELGWVPNLDAERMRELAEAELDRQSRRVHWFDTNKDGSVDAGESDIVIGSAGTGLTVSSAADTAKDYTDGLRYRPVLDNRDDR